MTGGRRPPRSGRRPSRTRYFAQPDGGCRADRFEPVVASGLSPAGGNGVDGSVVQRECLRDIAALAVRRR
ncbi:hypothetical protein UK15_32090 [Streptomyces variegatus]|uniref:Uncharacterized protein n=1 Tax=Streptomyces variegatus TaxID=284040 RepID=A0A0M2GJG2_9ACTN|nr:hypothetical protein UK15_32090 [Streptomyces variegatus]